MRYDMPQILKYTLVLVVLPAVLLTGCGTKEEAPGPMEMTSAEFEIWEIALVEMRIEKNEEFFQPDTTPLKAETLEGFEGLNYFFPQADLRFKTPFVAESGTDTVSLTKRQGQTLTYLRRGKVAFTYQDQVHHLEVFGPVDNTKEDYLWLPFYDQTSGKDTYAGGRYLDLKVDAEGMVDLDFNYAYNPLCDYNPDKYNCTMPPPGNKLDFAVEAGEKSFHAAD